MPESGVKKMSFMLNMKQKWKKDTEELKEEKQQFISGNSEKEIKENEQNLLKKHKQTWDH